MFEWDKPLALFGLGVDPRGPLPNRYTNTQTRKTHYERPKKYRGLFGKEDQMEIALTLIVFVITIGVVILNFWSQDH